MSLYDDIGSAPRHLAFGDRVAALNWPFLILITAVAIIGTATLYSVAGGSYHPWAEQHVIRYCIGLAILFAVALVDIRVWLHAAFPVYALALVLLVAVPIIGVESGGARRWIGAGGLTFQPAELMKVALVLALARYYQWLPAKHTSHPLSLLIPIGLIGAPLALVLMQPDLGTALLFAAVGAGMMYLAGVSWVYFVTGATAVFFAAPFVWDHLHAYQRERILTFVDPGRDPQGAGYHILQSKIAFGSGGITGKGYMQGTQSQLNFLPEKHTDFIFTMFAEEMGFIGSLTVMGLYMLMILFVTFMALRCRSPFARLLAGGVSITLFVYVFINMAMVMGLVPVVGVPLPLLSYGGTSIVTLMFGFGLALNAHVHRRTIFRSSQTSDL